MVSTRSGSVVAVGAQSAEVSSRRGAAAKSVPRKGAQGEPVLPCHCSVSCVCMCHLVYVTRALVGAAVLAYACLNFITAADLCPPI